MNQDDKNAPIFEVSLPDLESFLKKYEISRLKTTLFERFTILILSASGFVAALAWDDALKSLFRDLVGLAQGTLSKFIYALLVTFIAVGLSFFLGRKIIQKRKSSLK